MHKLALTASRVSGRASKGDLGDRGFYTSLIRLHVLHHAAKAEVYGFAMIGELRRHGYELGTGTLYPILHGMQKKGLLSSEMKPWRDRSQSLPGNFVRPQSA